MRPLVNIAIIAAFIGTVGGGPPRVTYPLYICAEDIGEKNWCGWCIYTDSTDSVLALYPKHTGDRRTVEPKGE